MSLPNFQDWRTQSRTMKLAAYSSTTFNLSTGGDPERIDGVRASGNLLSILGARYGQSCSTACPLPWAAIEFRG